MRITQIITNHIKRIYYYIKWHPRNIAHYVNPNDSNLTYKDGYGIGITLAGEIYNRLVLIDVSTKTLAAYYENLDNSNGGKINLYDTTPEQGMVKTTKSRIDEFKAYHLIPKKWEILSNLQHESTENKSTNQ